MRRIAGVLMLCLLPSLGCGGGGDHGAAPSEDVHPHRVVHDDQGREFVVLDSADRAQRAGISSQLVSRQTLQQTIRVNASAGYDENRYVQVLPRVEGIVRDVRVDVGSQVQPDDVLLVLDSTSFAVAKANYINTLKMVDHLQRNRVERLRVLASQEIIAGYRMLEEERLLQQETINAAEAKQKLRNLGFSEAKIDELVANADTGSELAIRAPSAGTVIFRHAVPGEAVQPTMEIFTLAELSTMWVHLDVYENAVDQLAVGQETIFHVGTSKEAKSYAGRLTWVSSEVDKQTRTIRARAEVANPDGMLRANMFGKAEIRIEKERQTITVPGDAVRQHDGTSIVFVPHSPTRYEARAVQLGVREGDAWEVASGLAEGEHVVTVGSFLLNAELEGSVSEGGHGHSH